MTVRCIRLLDAHGDVVVNSPWVTIGKTYHVLSISAGESGTKLRLVGDERIPAWFRAEMFEVVGGTIPGNWVVHSPSPGSLLIAPEQWTRSGFWEDFFNRVPEAVKSFEVERERIVVAD